MKTPAREEAPELKACPMCGLNEGLTVGQTKAAGLSWWSVECHGCCVSLSGPNSEAEAIAAWNTRADLANREPSEGEVERGARAIYATGQDLSDPDWSVTSEPRRERFRQAFLAAINAWRNP